MLKNKSKFIGILLAIVMLITVHFATVNMLSVKAQSYLGQTADDYFLQTIKEFGYEEPVIFEKDMLFDENLNENGFEYTFEVGKTSGYALMINVFDEYGNKYYDIMELFFDTASPFGAATGRKIYVKMFTYLEYINGSYYDIESGNALTEEQMNFVIDEGFEYRGVGNYTITTETIDYNSKNDNSYEFDYGLPSYTKCSYPDSCGCVAGGIVIGYYDVFLENLVPNFATGIMVNGNLRYLPQGNQTTAVIDSFYYSMSIAANNGVTVNSFKTGISSYVKGKGHSTSYNSVMSWGAFNYSDYVSQVNAGNPVALFYSKFNMLKSSSFVTEAGYDQLTVETYNANHVMVGSGYRNVEYFNSSGVNFRNDNYLLVSTGIGSKEKGFVRLNGNTKIDDAFGVKIF